MNDELPPSDSPPPQPSSIPKFVWLLVALSPSAIIMLVMGTAIRGHGNSEGDLIPLAIIDLALSFLGSAQLLRNPNRTKSAWLIGDFLLGIFFAVLNAGIGLLAGCALGVTR